MTILTIQALSALIAGTRDPQDFPLRLYQLISVEAPGAPSNYLWVRLE